MFTNPRANFYESSDGFSVEVMGQTGLVYREGERAMLVNSEILAGPAGLVIYHSSIVRWKPPHEAEIVSSENRYQIVRNIQNAFRSQGLEVEFSASTWGMTPEEREMEMELCRRLLNQRAKSSGSRIDTSTVPGVQCSSRRDARDKRGHDDQ
jgi:hypothetical protein